MGRSLRNFKQRKAVARSIIEPMLVGKRDRTIASTYKRLSPGSDGRIHTQLDPTGTTTMRLASSETMLEEASTNLQNMANKVAALDPLYHVRDIFVPLEGYVFAAGDYKQAEAITTAGYIRDKVWLEQMLAGLDTHRLHASHAFSVDEVQVSGRQRKTAKNVTYASLYGASVPTITQTINKDEHIHGIRVTQEEVRNVRNVLLQLHPLEQWWFDLEREILDQRGAVFNCFGQRRKLYDPDMGYRVKDAASFKSQSTVAWRMDKSIIECMETVDRPGDIELLLQIHDELLFMVKPEYLDELQERMTDIMERPFHIGPTGLYIPVEWAVGTNWGKLVEAGEDEALSTIARREGWL